MLWVWTTMNAWIGSWVNVAEWTTTNARTGSLVNVVNVDHHECLQRTLYEKPAKSSGAGTAECFFDDWNDGSNLDHHPCEWAHALIINASCSSLPSLNIWIDVSVFRIINGFFRTWATTDARCVSAELVLFWAFLVFFRRFYASKWLFVT